MIWAPDNKKMLSKAIQIPLLLIAIIIVVAIVFYLNSPAKATDSLLTEGLPIWWENCTVNTGGISEIVCRSTPFAISNEDSFMVGCQDSPDDPYEYVGEMGDYGSLIWYRVPEGFTLSVFPGHVPPDTIALRPPLFEQIEEYVALHPGLYIIAANQYVMQLHDDGQIVPAPLSSTGKQKYHPYPDPEPGCEANVQNPYVLEIRVTVAGDISGLNIQTPVMSYIYRVPKPAN